MGMPPEHAAFLRRGPYPVHPAAALEDGERELLARYGYWLEALATGVLSPNTPEQARFVRVARGEAEPRSAFESAWTRHQQAGRPAQPAVGPMELAGQLDRLQAARAALAAVRKEHAERRAAILEQVRPLLEALDAEFADRLRGPEEEAARLEAESREAVLAFGASFRHAGVHAVYARPRVTWDTQGLTQYAETHPEVSQFRRVGKPSVTLRFDAPAEGSPGEAAPAPEEKNGKPPSGHRDP